MISTEHWWNGADGGNRNTRRKTCLSATSSATDVNMDWPWVAPESLLYVAGDCHVAAYWKLKLTSVSLKIEGHSGRAV